MYFRWPFFCQSVCLFQDLLGGCAMQQQCWFFSRTSTWRLQSGVWNRSRDGCCSCSTPRRSSHFFHWQHTDGWKNHDSKCSILQETLIGTRWKKPINSLRRCWFGQMYSDINKVVIQAHTTLNVIDPLHPPDTHWVIHHLLILSAFSCRVGHSKLCFSFPSTAWMQF